MRKYDTIFILKPTLTDEERVAKIEFFKEVITKNGGEIKATDDWGMRELAYRIKKNSRGYYFVIYFETEPKNILELERNYRINEDVIRHIVVKYENKKEVKAWENMVQEANKKAS